MSDEQIFGSLVDGNDVDDAVTATLQKWSDTYLNRMCRKIGQPEGWLPSPGSYVHTNDPHYFPEDQPPVVVVAIPGLSGRPIRDGQKYYRAEWDVQLTIFVQANDRDATERLAKQYGAAFRELLLHKRSLGGFAAGISWHEEQYGTRVSDRDQRTLGACELRFSVDVRDVVKTLGGPPTPITTEPSDWPTASSVKVTLEPEPTTFFKETP
jgi:hypothetical protein